MTWDVDLLLALLDPETGRFRARRGMLRSMVAAATLAEAVYAGQLLLTGDRVRAAQVADSLVLPHDPGMNGRPEDIDDGSAPPEVMAGEEHQARAGNQGGREADPAPDVPVARETAAAASTEARELALAPAQQLEWPDTPARTWRLIRRVRRVALRAALERAQAESALGAAPRRPFRRPRFLIADPMRRDLILERLANVARDVEAEPGRDHTLLALLVAAGRLNVIAPNADRHERARIRHLAVTHWAAQAYRRSLGVDPLRDKRQSPLARRRKSPIAGRTRDRSPTSALLANGEPTKAEAAPVDLSEEDGEPA